MENIVNGRCGWCGTDDRDEFAEQLKEEERLNALIKENLAKIKI